MYRGLTPFLVYANVKIKMDLQGVEWGIDRMDLT
jgi:hypothetical protein